MTDTDFPALSVQRLAIVTPMANERRTAVEFVRQMLAEAAVFREVDAFAIVKPGIASPPAVNRPDQVGGCKR